MILTTQVRLLPSIVRLCFVNNGQLRGSLLSTDNLYSSLVDRADDIWTGCLLDGRSKHIHCEGRNCRDDGSTAPKTSGIVV